MRKILLSRLGSCLFLVFSVATADAQLTSLTEGFDDVTTLVPAGWVIDNNSSPIGNHDWGQGIDIADGGTLGANAQAGPSNSFIETDFQAGNPPGGAVVSAG